MKKHSPTELLNYLLTGHELVDSNNRVVRKDNNSFKMFYRNNYGSVTVDQLVKGNWSIKPITHDFIWAVKQPSGTCCRLIDRYHVLHDLHDSGLHFIRSSISEDRENEPVPLSRMDVLADDWVLVSDLNC